MATAHSTAVCHGGAVAVAGSGNDVGYSLEASGPEAALSSIGNGNVVHRTDQGAAGTSPAPASQESIVASDNGVDVVGPRGRVTVGPSGIDAKATNGANAEIKQLTAPPVPPQGGTLVITGAASVQEYDCAGRVVLVRSSASTIRLTGVCLGLHVEGSGNTVSVDLGRNAPIVIDGAGNTVRWRTPDGTEPIIQSRGSGNTILRFSGLAIGQQA
jgi:hypothetical protein